MGRPGSGLLFVRARELAAAVGNRELSAQVAAAYGSHLFHLGDSAGAAQQLTEALETHRVLGDRYVEAQALANLGIVHFNWNRPDDARRCYAGAKHIFHELDDYVGEATVLGHLGRWELEYGDLAEAIGLLEEATTTLGG
jgi:tetratricopeptide (TPR) repeat protein